jgi:hypothetical protein
MSDLVTLERAVYGRRPEAMAALRHVLLGLATDSVVVDQARRRGKDELTPALCTRITAAMSAALLDSGTAFGPEDFARLAVVHGAIVNAFVASGFGSADHALALLPPPPHALRNAADRQAYLRFWTLFGFDAAVDVELEQLLSGPPDLALLAYLQLLASKPIGTGIGHDRRDQLLELAPRLPPGRLPPTGDHVVLLSNAWMLCSYAEHPRKHEVKRQLNPVMRDCLSRLGATDAPPAPRRAGPSPATIVVASEIMHSNHVQYRYFGQYLRQLKERFRSVLVTDKREVDDHVRALFHEVHVFERRNDAGHLRQAAELVRSAAPDLLYMPSVGMRHWGVALANLRLAPIQVMGLGHTATSYCETMDYCIAEAGLVSGPGVWHETMVTIPDEAHVLERSPHYTPLAPEIRERPTPLRIALPSNLLKLNPRFLSFLADLQGRTRRPLQFHLFPNVSGVELIAARAIVGRLLPNANVHPIMAYNRYLERLNQCDLNLSPFPFGGMHSVIDSVRQGLPVVALEGQESHNRTDAMLLRRFAMPEWLICHDETTYAATALRLIEDDALRVAVSRQAAGCGVDARIYGDATTPLRREFADAVSWILAHHEAAKADGRRIWSPEDRAMFRPGG